MKLEKERLKIALDNIVGMAEQNSMLAGEELEAIDELHALIESSGEAEVGDEEGKLRELLWLNHGCPFSALYGDDGEMQCGRCGIDFKCTSAQNIKEIWFKFRQRQEAKVEDEESEYLIKHFDNLTKMAKYWAEYIKYYSFDEAYNQAIGKIRALLRQRRTVNKYDVKRWANYLEGIARTSYEIEDYICNRLSELGFKVEGKHGRVKGQEEAEDELSRISKLDLDCHEAEEKA